MMAPIRPEADPNPPVLARTVETPRGLPWDQARAARLEAGRVAPLPIETMMLKLQRLEPWRHGAKGRFAALYVRKDQVGDGLKAVARLGERTIPVEFRSPRQVKADLRSLVLLAVAGGVAATVCFGAVGAAALRRGETVSELTRLERLAARRLRQAQESAELKRQNTALSALAEPGEPLDEVLADLAWASRNRAPEARIEGFHWRPTAYGIEARGDIAPFTTDDFSKAPRPLRAGVELWAKRRDGSR